MSANERVGRRELFMAKSTSTRRGRCRRVDTRDEPMRVCTGGDDGHRGHRPGRRRVVKQDTATMRRRLRPLAAPSREGTTCHFHEDSSCTAGQHVQPERRLVRGIEREPPLRPGLREECGHPAGRVAPVCTDRGRPERSGAHIGRPRCAEAKPEGDSRGRAWGVIRHHQLAAVEDCGEGVRHDLFQRVLLQRGWWDRERHTPSGG